MNLLWLQTGESMPLVLLALFCVTSIMQGAYILYKKGATMQRLDVTLAGLSQNWRHA
ncbi:hypothetical protein [Pontivivens insulae]|uniref:Uncharacterized protein n=1 Tax=Pontivivens insulae TaxID=1639689 RepID=A0A2R8AEQ8_9RHOB|nr:hypothetical protein [Pontivivens insulae]RED11773.1 hypothetical protein DFR53_2483 [Pontivivens insulae]SPF30530.1 hypothetical protein POI8812_02869 [Pontivivens insulae]